MTLSFSNPERALQQIHNEQILDTISRAEPRIAESRLNNGMRFVAIEDQRPIAVSSIVVHFDAGSRREATEHQGKMHFFEHLPPGAFQMANQGMDIVTFARKNGWDLQIGTSQDSVRIGFRCCDFDIHHATKTVISILEYGDDLFRQAFSLEKGRILSEIDQHSVNIKTLFAKTLDRLLTGDSGYGHFPLGDRKQVERYTFEDVINFGKPFFNARNATLAVLANTADTENVAGNFENLQLSPANPLFDLAPVIVPSQWSSIDPVTHIPTNLSAGITIMGLLPGASRQFSRESEIIRALDNVLGADIFRELSAKSGLTYSAETFRYRYPGSGGLISMFAMDPKNVSRATEMFLKIIDSLSNSITEETLAANYKRLRNDAYKTIAAYDCTESLNQAAAFPHQDIPSWHEILSTASSLSVDEVRSYAKDRLGVEQLKFAVFGEASLLKQLPINLRI